MIYIYIFIIYSIYMIFIIYVNPRENTSISVPSGVQYRLGGEYMGSMIFVGFDQSPVPGNEQKLRITPPRASTRAIMSRRGKCKSFKVIWLVVDLPLWKIWVSWDDDSQYMEK